MKIEPQILTTCCIDYVMTEEINPETLEALVLDVLRLNETSTEMFTAEALTVACHEFLSITEDIDVIDIVKFISVILGQVELHERMRNLLMNFPKN